MVKEVIWSKVALNQLMDAYEFILNDSYQNAIKVKDDLLNSTKILSENFEKYPLDKYKLNNDGSFRAFEIHNYRISYRIKPKQIRILKIRHTKMNPQNF